MGVRCPVTILMAAAACVHGPAEAERTTVNLRIIALNDFHGQLQPLEAGRSEPESRQDPTWVGGAPHLASHIHSLRQDMENAIVVSAGDLFGASPLVSALFHDEPTIEAMNLIGLDLNGVGNHEFDDGLSELLRMKQGGCHPEEGCQGRPTFGGAEFGFLAANVVDHRTGDTIFPAYEVRQFDGVSVAFIGLTLKATPDMLPPIVPNLTFHDEAETTNVLVEELQARGVRSVVLLLHEGGFPEGSDPNRCEGLSGPILEILDKLDPEVDLVISGHTHQAYICFRPGLLLTSGGSLGRLVTTIDLELDRKTGDVQRVRARNHAVHHEIPPDPRLTRSVDHYVQKAAPRADRMVTRLRQPLTRERTMNGLSVLGRVIADAQLAATRESADAEFALMNAGGIRTEVAPTGGEDGLAEVTYGMLFSAQPFGNRLVTLTLSGAEVLDILESQFRATPPRFFDGSSNLSYRWQKRGTTGGALLRDTVEISGKALEPERSYRVTVNTFMAARDLFAKGRNPVVGPEDLEALVNYLKARNPFEAPGMVGIEVENGRRLP